MVNDTYIEGNYIHMKVVSLEAHKQSLVRGVIIESDNYQKAVDKQYAKEVAKELTKGYMKLLSSYTN